MKIVEITALWCPACIIVSNNIKKAIKDENIEVVKYDFDFDEDIVKEYEIKRLPVVLFFDEENKEISRLIGEVSEKAIRNVIIEVRKK